MNYGPYMGFPYYTMPSTSTGLFSRLFGNFSLSGLLNGTQKTLNVVNQVIPVIKQVKPVVNNAKTMFRVMSEFNKSDTDTKKNNINTNNTVNEKIVSTEEFNGPKFFI